MKFLKLSLCAAAASVGLYGAANAETAPAPPSVTWAVNGAVTSDYVFRGISQTGTYDPAVQGGVDLGYSIGYAGVWASNVKFGNGTDAEVDLYGGIRPKAGPVTFDLGVIGYLYPGAPSGANENYVEFKGAASVPAGPITLGTAVYYSPDFTFTPGTTNSAVYYEANASFSPAKPVTISGAVGHQSISGPYTDYTTWNLGLTFNFLKHLSLDGRYWDTDHHSTFGKYGNSRFVVTLKATYP